MKTNKKILETLLKIQEFIESIADNQHRPNSVFYKPYSLPIPNWDNDNEEQKPFPKYWWTYTEGLPDVIKDWFNANHKGKISFNNEVSVIAFNKEYGFWYCDSDYGCEYVTHQQIIDHYGLEETPQGLSESWCIDIRVDDPRVEGFKEWLNSVSIGCVFSFRFYGFNHVNGMYDRWNEWEENIPQILTLDQFEEMSGVNLMDYIKKEEVKIEPDESPFKVGDKVVIDEEYYPDELLLYHLRKDVILSSEEYIIEDIDYESYYEYGNDGAIKLKGKKWWHYAGNFKKVHESQVFTENEQPKKLYTKEEILAQYEQYHIEDDFLQTFGDWIRQNM